MIFEAVAPYNSFPRRYRVDDADGLIRPHAIHWLVCIETYKELKLPQVGFSWVLEFDSEETCVYRFRDERIVGFRGTHTSKDLYDDFKIAMGSVFPRAIEGIEFVSGLLLDDPNVSVELCGHSLGGAIAREVGGRLGLRVVTFNAAAPPTDPVVSSLNEIDYHIVFDIISAWQSPNTVRIDKGHRPIPTFWQRLTPVTWLHASTSGLIEAHKLSNFSSEVYGKVMCGEEETSLFKRWLASLPSSLRSFLYFSIFGVSGVVGFPSLEGCFGLR
jgi:hypothetical protein